MQEIQRLLAWRYITLWLTHAVGAAAALAPMFEPWFLLPAALSLGLALIGVRDQRIRPLERLLDRFLANHTVWATMVGEVASHHQNSANKDRFQVSSRLQEAIEPKRFGKAEGVKAGFPACS